GATRFFDVNGNASGFGSPVSSTAYDLNGAFWTTDANGVSPAPSAWASSDTMTFGTAAGDTTLQGTFTVNVDNAGTLNTVTVNSTGLNITLTNNNINTHPSGGGTSTWTVNSGSTLIMGSCIRQGFDAGGTTALKGFNYNNQAVS